MNLARKQRETAAVKHYRQTREMALALFDNRKLQVETTC